MPKTYVVQEKGVQRITAVDFDNNAYSISADPTFIMTNVELVIMGMKLCAIGMKGPRPDDKDQESQLSTLEAWCKENGVEIEP